jgi:hypothetical protein
MTKNTSMGPGSDKKTKLNLVFSIIAFLELIAAGIITLTISPDPKNSWLLGFSAQRWALMLFTFFLAICVLILGRVLDHREITLKSVLRIKTNSFAHRLFLLTAFLLFLWGLCSVFSPSYYFGNWAPYYERLRPLSITVGLILLQFSLVSIFLDKKINLHLLYKSPFLGVTFLFAACIIALAIFIATTKIGLVKDTAYWNVPGVPLSGQQFLIVVISICLGMYLFPKEDQIDSSKGLSRFAQFLPFLIYLGAVLAWGLTPMLKHFFSVQPTPPNFQPFPFSDARVNDLGGLSIIRGYGIYFHGYTDKPLYMIFLSFFHLIAGNNYSLLTWIQILVLGFIPVVLYLLGKKFYGQGFGLFLALITILRQRNAIVLSYKIASVNPKLLITEVMTLLGIVLLAYVVFLWLRTQKLWLAALSGGILGAASLIRMNPFFLFPVIACLVLVAFWKLQKLKWKHLAFYTLGFLIIVTPWFITGVNQNGVPWTLVKVTDVINNRYGNVIQPSESPINLPVSQETPTTNPTESVLSTQPPISSQVSTQQPTSPVSLQPAPGPNLQSFSIFEEIAQFSDLFINHFLHNFSTSVLALPDSLTYNDLTNPNELNDLSLRPYWIDGNDWQGELPSTQVFFIFLNLIFIAIGLGYSWNRFHWAGLVPLVIFLGYDLSLAFALNSGSRYIVPIDWILYFYYGLTFVCVIRWVTNSLFGQVQGDMTVNMVSPADAANKKKIQQSFIALIIIASLIPIADDVVPLFFGHPSQSVNLEGVVNSIPIAQRNDTTILIGEVLYPYYDKNLIYSSNAFTHINGNQTFDFDLLASQKTTSYSVNLEGRPLKVTLLGGETILVGLRTQGANPEVRFIYLLMGSSLKLLWESNPTN